MKGGLAAVRELIASRFKEVHGDVRDADQVRASQELVKSLADAETVEVELVETEEVGEPQPQEYTETEAAKFDQKAEILATVACNIIPAYLRCPRQRHWWAGSIDGPTPDVERLYADALRSLGVEVEKEKS